MFRYLWGGNLKSQNGSHGCIIGNPPSSKPASCLLGNSGQSITCWKRPQCANIVCIPEESTRETVAAHASLPNNIHEFFVGKSMLENLICKHVPQQQVTICKHIRKSLCVGFVHIKLCCKNSCTWLGLALQSQHDFIYIKILPTHVFNLGLTSAWPKQCRSHASHIIYCQQHKRQMFSTMTTPQNCCTYMFTEKCWTELQIFVCCLWGTWL